MNPIKINNITIKILAYFIEPNLTSVYLNSSQKLSHNIQNSSIQPHNHFLNSKNLLETIFYLYFIGSLFTSLFSIPRISYMVGATSRIFISSILPRFVTLFPDIMKEPYKA